MSKTIEIDGLELDTVTPDSPEALAQRMQQHGLDGLALGGTPPAGF